MATSLRRPLFFESQSIVIFAGLAAVFAPRAAGDVTAYSNRLRYRAALASTSVEDFVSARPPSVFQDFGSFTAQTDSDTFLEVVSGYLRKAGAGVGPDFVRLSFPVPVYGVGIDILDFGNPTTGEMRVVTNTGSFDCVIAEYDAGTPEKYFFFGVTDTSGFTSITFSNTTVGDSIGYDTLEFTIDPLPPRCPADFNGDGFVTGEDFDAFIVAFESGDRSTDFDNNCFVSGDDFDAFVAAFVAGC